MTAKTLVTFIFGAAVGAVGSYFVTKEALKTKTQMEINEMREYYKEQYGVKDKKPVDQSNDADADPDGIVTTGEDGKDIYTKLNTVVHDYHTESELVADEKKQEKHAMVSQYQKPYEITEDEYLNDKKWSHMEYNWYYHHKVMMNVSPDVEEPYIVEDPIVQVGADNLEALEESGEGLIYVRNDNRGELYFISLCAGEPPIDPETYSSPLPDDDEDEIY